MRKRFGVRDLAVTLCPSKVSNEGVSTVATMAEVAALAGVSITTVSHVLNSSRPVNPETRSRVEKAIADLDYRRNHAARTLAGGSSRTIGLVISGLTNTHFGPLLHAIERRVSDADHVLVLGDSHDEEAMERRVVDSLLDRSVDGLIVAPSAGFMNDTAQRIARSGKPLVLIDRGLELDCDQLVPENTQSVHALTTHLIEHGHTRIAAVAGLPGLDSSDERIVGFRTALEEHDLLFDESFVVPGMSHTDTAYDVVSELLALPEPPTAIISLNNAMTIGTLRAVTAAGLSVPHDLAIAAYDDFEWADMFQPGLTAIAQDVTRMGTDAVDLLIRRIHGDDSPHEHRVIATTFHRRTSCGCAPQDDGKPAKNGRHMAM